MHSKCPAKQACVVFSPNSPVVVCGGEDGGVRVYRLFNVDREYDMLDEQLERLEDTLRANAMKAAPGTRA